MPCWTVQESAVNLDKSNPDLLRAALEAIGFRVNTNEYSARFGCAVTADRFRDGVSLKVSRTGSITVTSSDTSTNLAELGNEVKRAYSAQVIKTAAKRFGWNVKQTENKFQVKRRF